jgi:hypothetical protein
MVVSTEGKDLEKLTLAFGANEAIDDAGLYDIALFLIRGRFDVATNAAYWIKAYVGMHTVDYFGAVLPRAICGDRAFDGPDRGLWGSGQSLRRRWSRPSRIWRSRSRWWRSRATSLIP